MKFLFIALMLLLMLPACATKPKKLKPWPWDFAWLMDAMFYNQQDYDPPPAEAGASLKLRPSGKRRL